MGNQPLYLVVYKIHFLKCSLKKWFLYPCFSCQGWRLQCQLRWWHCCVIFNSHSVLSETLLTDGFTLEALLERLSLLLLSQAGWLLPAPLPFMHADVEPQITHTPDSHILHMKIIGSKFNLFALPHLGPRGSSISFLHVQIHGCPPELSSWRLPVHFPTQHHPSGFGVLSPTTGVPQIQNCLPKPLAACFFLGDSPDHCTHMHILFLSAAPAWHFLNMFLTSQAGTEDRNNLWGLWGCRASPRTSTNC